jgi:hypothetical protein
VLRNQGVGAPASAVIIYRCSDYIVYVLEALLLIYFLLSLLDVIACRTTGSFGHSCAPEESTPSEKTTVML